MTQQYDLTAEILTDRAVPVLTVQRKPVDPEAPIVIVLHGLHGCKESYLEEVYLLAQLGFRAVAIDLALHGEQKNSGESSTLFAENYVGAIHKVIYDTSADISALLDHWAAPQRSVGLFAVSAGGLAGHAVSINDGRIGAFAAIITSPDWLAVDPKLTPESGTPLAQMLESLSPANHPEAYPPIALLMLVGEDDDVVSPIGSKLLYERLLPLYSERGIGGALELRSFPELGHSYTPEMRALSLKWLVDHLLKK